MYIKCWGSRGSIPVSGREYIKYGGDTPCIEVRTKDDQIIIVDAGTGIRRVGDHLIAEGRYNYDFIFTHAHWDHLLGFSFFKPIYIDQTNIKIQGCPIAQEAITNMLKKVMSPPTFPVRYNTISADITYTSECSEYIERGNS